MSAISLDYKYYPYIALAVGFYLGGVIGAIASFLFVRKYLSPKKNETTYELALLKLSSLLIKSDWDVESETINPNEFLNWYE